MSNIDLIGDYIEGELSSQEIESLKQTLRADEELARFADEYAWVHRLTAFSSDSTALPEPVAAEPQDTPLRRAAGLALAVAAGACTVFFLMREPQPSRVQLNQISLTARPVSTAHADLPRSLSTYRSVERGIVRFASSIEDARAIARGTERLVFVLYGTPNCPICYRIKATTLIRPEAVEAMSRLVAVEANLYDLPEDEQEQWLAEGYPWIEVQDADGTLIRRFSGASDPAEFFEELRQGFQARPSFAQPPEWSVVHSLARDHARARSFELERRYANALRIFDELAETELPAFAAAGRFGQERIASEARAQLLDAWASSQSRAAEAQEILEQANEDFAGTPFAADLDRVREEMRATGTFPRLVPASREERGPRSESETGE